MHNFHLVINKKDKNEIIKLSNQLNINIAETSSFIIHKMIPLLECYYFTRNDSKLFNSKKKIKPTEYFVDEVIKYHYIKGDKQLHIKIPIKYYNKIKHIHAGINTWSMAILIRWMIIKFIWGIKKYGFYPFIKIIQKYTRININKYKRLKHWKLFNYNNSAFQDSRKFYNLTFDGDYNLIELKLLI